MRTYACLAEAGSPPITLLGCFIWITLGTPGVSALASTDPLQQTVSADEPAHLPPNLVVGAELRDLVAQMLRESNTFRRQVEFIARHQRLRIRILLEDPHVSPRPRAVRAQCDLARYEFGGITAVVHVWSIEDAIELVAHELEHIIEIAEGMNYRIMALLQPSAVWVVDSGAFETSRAIDTGLQVKRESWLAGAHARRH